VCIGKIVGKKYRKKLAYINSKTVFVPEKTSIEGSITKRLNELDRGIEVYMAIR